MSVEIRLSKDAAAQAQHLVVELANQGIAVEPLNPRDSDRDVLQSLNDLVVALVAGASYDLVRAIVSAWIHRFGLGEDQVEVVDHNPEVDTK